jgi:hypothetical protein
MILQETLQSVVLSRKKIVTWTLLHGIVIKKLVWTLRNWNQI